MEDIVVGILRAILFVVIAYAVVFVAALVNIVFERRVLAFMQDRHPTHEIADTIARRKIV